MQRQSTRAWLSGLAVTISTIVCYFAFWHISPGVTFIVGCVALVSLIVAGWILGRDGKSNPRVGK